MSNDRQYIPCLYVLNKIDDITIEELDILSKVPHYVPICAAKEWNFDELLEKIWSYLNMLRMFAPISSSFLWYRSCCLLSYTKPKGQIPDYEAPVILPTTKNTVEQFCARIHKSLLAQFK